MVFMAEELYFSNEFEHSLDSQGRIAIPRQWRRKDGENRFFLAPGRDNILLLIPFETFKDFLDKARRISFANAKMSLALARFGSKGQDCKCDKQGRVPIPQRLMDYAGLENHVVLVGAITHVQIWQPARWSGMQGDEESCFDILEEIGGSPDGGLMDLLKGGMS